MKSTRPLILDRSKIAEAAEYLRKGELVAFPTETVYGLGADASNEEAIKKLYATKGRPKNHPVIVHLAGSEQVSNWCEELPEYARLLAQHFWPGPMTLIVKRAKHVSDLITGGQDTVGLRVPAHPCALALLREFGHGIVAPSANKYGRISATSAEHVQEEFGSEVRVIIDGGRCPVGIESTIVDVTGSMPKILRLGVISEAEILNHIGSNFVVNDSGPSRKHIRVPGSDKAHYAPKTPMLLVGKSSLDGLLREQNNAYNGNNTLSYGVLAFGNTEGETVISKIQAPSDVRSYARDLYANLRKLDKSGASYILVEMPPQTIEWAAIIDRLNRASTKL
jgi:L-threonylcarbamoyladenylate synthase